MEDRVARGQVQFAINELADHMKRIVNLEQQVANQALAMQALKQMADSKTLASEPSASMKSQAAAAQATEHLYAPLRSDTKPLLEMSAFVRKVASFESRYPRSTFHDSIQLRDLVAEAQEILKRST